MKLTVNTNKPNEIENTSRSSRVDVDFAAAGRESWIHGRIGVADRRVLTKIEKDISKLWMSDQYS